MGEGERGSGPRPLGDLLAGLMKQFGPKRRAELEELSDAWGRAAGPDVARRTRVMGLVRETLTVAVESAPLRQELEQFRKPLLLERMRLEYPGRRIGELRCVLRPTS